MASNLFVGNSSVTETTLALLLDDLSGKLGDLGAVVVIYIRYAVRLFIGPEALHGSGTSGHHIRAQSTSFTNNHPLLCLVTSLSP